MNWLNPELIWFLVGLAVLIGELLVSGFILIFFGFGAWFVALLVWAGFLNSLNLQLFIFLVFSVLSLVILRRWLTDMLKGSFNKSNYVDDDFQGREARVIQKITSYAPGRVEFNGTSWAATADQEILVDTWVEIIEKKDLTLKVRLKTK